MSRNCQTIWYSGHDDGTQGSIRASHRHGYERLDTWLRRALTCRHERTYESTAVRVVPMKALGLAIKAVRALEISHLEHLEELLTNRSFTDCSKRPESTRAIDLRERCRRALPALFPFGLATGSGIASAF